MIGKEWELEEEEEEELTREAKIRRNMILLSLLVGIILGGTMYFTLSVPPEAPFAVHVMRYVFTFIVGVIPAAFGIVWALKKRV